MDAISNASMSSRGKINISEHLASMVLAAKSKAFTHVRIGFSVMTLGCGFVPPLHFPASCFKWSLLDAVVKTYPQIAQVQIQLRIPSEVKNFDDATNIFRKQNLS